MSQREVLISVINVGSDGFSAQSSSPAYTVHVIGGSGNVCNVTYLVSNT